MVCVQQQTETVISVIWMGLLKLERHQQSPLVIIIVCAGFSASRHLITAQRDEVHIQFVLTCARPKSWISCYKSRVYLSHTLFSRLH